ncbi:MAG: hypothetical protein BWY82_02384 [Verrucomicrobia bacterium ADurb.Bin474]|nr:MAG: hypothetical protein BWY82_02384 [Verrucomicrobia bacterium ADurb.Bin474]
MQRNHRLQWQLVNRKPTVVAEGRLGHLNIQCPAVIDRIPAQGADHALQWQFKGHGYRGCFDRYRGLD